MSGQNLLFFLRGIDTRRGWEMRLVGRHVLDRRFEQESIAVAVPTVGIPLTLTLKVDHTSPVKVQGRLEAGGAVAVE